MRVLVIGRGGQVSNALAARASGDVEIVQAGLPELDLCGAYDEAAVIVAAKPDVVINATAYTAVDKAETDQDRAALLNAIAPARFAAAARAAGAAYLHIGTDYVFPGTGDVAYAEDDDTGPRNLYGVTKRDGEIAVLDAFPDAAILRTSWVYDATGANFLRTMLRLGREREELRVVDDQIGAPTCAGDIADVLLVMGRAMRISAPPPEGFGGLYHYQGGGETSWKGFADAIFDAAEPVWGRRPRVEPIPTSAYPTPAVRPSNSRLSMAKIARVFGIAPIPWRDRVGPVVREALAHGV